jgi:hypothetical protein
MQAVCAGLGERANAFVSEAADGSWDIQHSRRNYWLRYTSAEGITMGQNYAKMTWRTLSGY